MQIAGTVLSIPAVFGNHGNSGNFFYGHIPRVSVALTTRSIARM